MLRRLKPSGLVLIVLILIATISAVHTQTQTSREIPASIAARLEEWYTYFLVWATLHYALGVTSAVLSVIVATVDFSDEKKKVRTVLAVIAAATVALLTLLTPAANAKAYIQAWRVLDSACRQYQVDSAVPLAKLNEAVDEGERAIATGVIGAF